MMMWEGDRSIRHEGMQSDVLLPANQIVKQHLWEDAGSRIIAEGSLLFVPKVGRAAVHSAEEARACGFEHSDRLANSLAEHYRVR